MSAPAPEVAIRVACPEDIEVILNIEARWATTPKWTRAHFEREITWEKAHFCVAEEKGTVVGYAGLWKLPPEAQVTTIAVDPGRARRGLGMLLMRHLHTTAIATGCVVIGLEVSAGNAGALELYDRLGYRVVGRRPKYYNDGSDALLMTAHLR